MAPNIREEIHADVVEYPRERLCQFIKTNSAIDEYECCIPQFTQGNCLSLAFNNRRYHRVNCTAAFPETYELHVKHLIEIGGNLVMPMNDQCLQVRLMGENSWTVTSMLHVSFSTLLPSLRLWLLTCSLRGSLRAAERTAASQVINARPS
jgi:hypothetical protein